MKFPDEVLHTCERLLTIEIKQYKNRQSLDKLQRNTISLVALENPNNHDIRQARHDAECIKPVGVRLMAHLQEGKLPFCIGTFPANRRAFHFAAGLRSFIERIRRHWTARGRVLQIRRVGQTLPDGLDSLLEDLCHPTDDYSMETAAGFILDVISGSYKLLLVLAVALDTVKASSGKQDAVKRIVYNRPDNLPDRLGRINCLGYCILEMSSDVSKVQGVR